MIEGEALGRGETISAVPPAIASTAAMSERSFDDRFRREFEQRHPSLYRYLARLSDDPALAADIAQDAFVRLYQRRSMPDDPGAWLFAVANNLIRNQWHGRKRRARVLSADRGTFAIADPPPAPDALAEAADRQRFVRAALDTLSTRDRELLLLRYEGHSYRELAIVLGLTETSVGTLLARAKSAFRRALGEGLHAHE
ncbi:MAG: sigma-70 family RNA polymerase sigma factor [Gemmatimonadota bacterium]|nr:sigma-70 family RNA polymerase sigma factor [Gemmatimonadota bacterium]